MSKEQELQNVTDMQQKVEQLQQDNAALLDQIDSLVERATDIAANAGEIGTQLATMGAANNFFLTGLTVFVLAIFVGYYVVWGVTPALHSPLMAVTNAVSSVIIVGALVAAGSAEDLASISLSNIWGFLAVILAGVNIFGGFIVTQRMLAMYKKKQ